MSKAASYFPLDSSTGLSALFVDHVASLGTNAAIASEINNIAAARKNFAHRELLVQTLKRQYVDAGISLTKEVDENISALSNDYVFTVTTGHQLCVFSGPLYVIHKIISAVYQCRELNKVNKTNRFVPVYWMATEDHDIEEISSVNIFREKFTVQFSGTGATGMLNSGDVVKNVEALKQLAGDLPFASEILDIIHDCYRNGVLLKHAHRKFIHALTAHLGVIIIDGDDVGLKKTFQPVFEAELFDQVVVKNVNRQNEKLIKNGYSPQVNPRDINIFYLSEGSRLRIEKSGDGFNLVGSDKTISKQEMESIVKNNPEKLSPNVLLRPLYQCTVLPDAAMVGGPAEIAYWKQLDLLFDTCQLVMPLLLPRMFAFYVNDKQAGILENLQHEKLGLFSGEPEWTSVWVKKHAPYVSFENEKKEIDKLFETLTQKASEVDKSLVGFIASEKSRSEKFLAALDEKMIRSLKKNSEQEINALRQLHAKLFPEGSWQERHESALPYLWRYGKSFVDKVYEHVPSSVSQCVVIIG